ncbi:hypothetical protein [Polaromonas sp. CG9_12]|nr:hypothetical protein [Polaromonas sp. CG9_12]
MKMHRQYKSGNQEQSRLSAFVLCRCTQCPFLLCHLCLADR